MGRKKLLFWTESRRLSRSLLDIVESAIARVPYVSTMESHQEICDSMANASIEDQDSFIAWGKYGWTVNILADYSIYFYTPESQEEADRRSLKYCTNDLMDKYFERLLSEKLCKKTVLKEAIFCFKNRKYRACACLLFALMDGEMIKSQSIDNNRKFGERGIKFLKSMVNQRKDVKNATLLFLEFQCLNSALASVFASDANFLNEPVLINRNYVMHGMITRRILRKDCVQLFLIYGNLLRYIDFYSKIKDIPEDTSPTVIEVMKQRMLENAPVQNSLNKDDN